MTAALLVPAAFSAGFSAETRYASAAGPDAWGTLDLRATSSQGVHTGAVLLGGTRSAILGTFGASLPLGPVTVDGTAFAGMLRTIGDLTGGPTGGGSLALGVDPGLTIHAEGGYLLGIGGWFEGGVDPELSERWALLPLARLDTWSGDRDPEVRAGMGLRWTSPRGVFAALSASAGGRDVVHLGPGFTASIGRLP